jgi:hypothetical protein
MCTKVVSLVFLMVFAEQTLCHHVGAAQYHPGSTIEIEGKICWRQTPTVWSLSATLSEQPDGIYQ